MQSRRTVRPVGLFFWGSTWSATAWCELRNAFRNFRIDRMAEVHVLDERFTDAPGQTLEDFLKLAEDWRLAQR